jgi:hypothetical protein
MVRQAVRDQGNVSGPTGALRPSSKDRQAGDEQALPGLELADGTDPSAAVAHHSMEALAELPPRAVDLTAVQRSALGKRLATGWPPQAKAAYESLSEEVAIASAARWRAALSGGKAAAESMLWRLLRVGATPYFVLGSSTTQTLRLRIATSWDWRQQFALNRLEIFAQSGGQPRVGWNATVKARASGVTHTVSGHMEVRWSHGRFGGPPEAKGYLDTPHHLVPGYFALR